MGATQVLAAEDVSEPWHLSVYGGGSFPKDDEIDNAFTLGARVTYEFLKNLEAGLDISWQQYEDKFSGTKLGDVNHIPLYAIVKYGIALESLEDQVVPYILAGIGLSFWNYDEAISSVSADSDVSFTGKIGVGADVKINSEISVFAEGGYFWADYDLNGSVFGTPVSGTVDVDSAFINGGLRLSF